MELVSAYFLGNSKICLNIFVCQSKRLTYFISSSGLIHDFFNCKNFYIVIMR